MAGGKRTTQVTTVLRSDPSMDLPRSSPAKLTRRTGTHTRGTLCAWCSLLYLTDAGFDYPPETQLGAVYYRGARRAVAPTSTDALGERNAAADVTRFTNSNTRYIGQANCLSTPRSNLYKTHRRPIRGHFDPVNVQFRPRKWPQPRLAVMCM